MGLIQENEISEAFGLAIAGQQEVLVLGPMLDLHS